ncbi:hypothetical protein K5X82_11970 [Halosquirtibacter xylanolyticus]|uniref:hypothetical protein n=1 Tax=Halosquirtibacter xylanolyticus TaxID=3374599 RepID=UPI003749E5E7|nr:hypothetical protein K5X82_11970 [Prolixibacteraceae bacterium]
MRTLEKILEFVLFIGIVFRVMLVNNGYLLEGIALGALGVFYLIWSFIRFRDYSFIKKDNATCQYDPITKRMSLFAGIGLFITCVGAAEHLIFITSNNVIVLIGMLLLLFVAVSEIIVYKKEKRVYISRVFKRVFVWLILGCVVWYISGVSSIEIIYRKHPRFIKAYKAVKKSPDNEQLRDIMWREYDRAIGKDGGSSHSNIK